MPRKRRTREELAKVREAMLGKLGRKRVRVSREEQSISKGGAPSLFHDMLIIPPRNPAASSEERKAPAPSPARLPDLFRVPVVKLPRAVVKQRPAAPEARASGRAKTETRTSSKQSPANSVVGNTAVADENFPDSEPTSGQQAVPVEVAGDYVDTPEKLDLYDYAQRRTLSIARPQDWGSGDAHRRGPAFGTLPVKREPAATHCFACYLVDAENFSFRNAWTAEEWNDIAPEDLEPHPSADDPYLKVLVAGPRGKVFRLELRLAGDAGKDLWPANRSERLAGDSGFVKSLDLRHQGEIWNQLRNGIVAGRVMVRGSADETTSLEPIDYLPLVNATSLVPDEPVEAAIRDAAPAQGDQS